MNCLFCQSQTIMCTNSHDFRINKCQNDDCLVEYVFSYDQMTRIVFSAIHFNKKYYLMILDLESDRTWLGFKNYIDDHLYKAIYDKKGLLNVTPQNLLSKIKTILVFS